MVGQTHVPPDHQIHGHPIPFCFSDFESELGSKAPRLQGSVRSPSLFVRRLKEVRDLVESLLVVKPKDRPRAREVMATNNWLIANGRPVEADEVVQMG